MSSTTCCDPLVCASGVGGLLGLRPAHAGVEDGGAPRGEVGFVDDWYSKQLERYSPSLPGPPRPSRRAGAPRTNGRCRHSNGEAQGKIAPPPPGHFDVCVLGSGVSAGCPLMNHVFQPGGCPNAETAYRKCDGRAICIEALDPGSRNARCNVSLLLRFVPPAGAQGAETPRPVVLMVDAGKTLREACLKSFPKLGVATVDVLLLTHDHADAMMGLDDLRDLQQTEEVKDPETGAPLGWRVVGAGPMRIISNQQTLRTSRTAFPYLKRAPEFAAPGVVYRRVAQFHWEQLPFDACALDLHGLPVRTFPVYHGGEYISLGFCFGRSEGADGRPGPRPLVYISDVSGVPPETETWLREAPIEVLVVDALRRERHGTHFSLQEAVDFVRLLRPRRALFVGMSSCELGDHDEVNAELRQLGAAEGLDMQLAHDGLMLEPMATVGPEPGDPAACQLCEPQGY